MYENKTRGCIWTEFLNWQTGKKTWDCSTLVDGDWWLAGILDTTLKENHPRIIKIKITISIDSSWWEINFRSMSHTVHQNVYYVFSFCKNALAVLEEKKTFDNLIMKLKIVLSTFNTSPLKSDKLNL